MQCSVPQVGVARKKFNHLRTLAMRMVATVSLDQKPVMYPEHPCCGNESHHGAWLLWHHLETAAELKDCSQVEEILARAQEMVRSVPDS